MTQDKVEVLLDKETAPGHVEDRIGVGQDEKLRSSARRENYLRRLIRVLTATNLSLKLHPSNAHTRFDVTPPEIELPAPPDGFPQPVTDIRTKVYEMLMQETVGLHEAGHVLYTDFGAYEEAIDDIEVDYRPVFKRIWNIMEDGAIEAQLRNEFKCEEELLIYNANMAANKTLGTPISPNEVNYTLHNAVEQILLDLCIFNTGTGKEILDPNNDEHVIPKDEDRELLKDFLPEIESTAKAYLSEPDGRSRVAILLDFWEDYKELLDEAEVGGKQSAQNREGELLIPGKGQDALDGYDLRGMDESNKEPEFEATELPDLEDLDEDIDLDVVIGDDGDEQLEMDGLGGSMDDTEEIEEAEEQYEQEVRREAEEEAGDMLEEALEYLDIIQEGGGASDTELEDFQVGVAEQEESWDTSEWNEVERRSNLIEGALRRRLRRQRRSKTKRNQRRGRFDERAMIKVQRGSPRGFKREVEPDKKDYACMVVMDRSGSMRGEKVSAAQKGAAAFLNALYNLDIDASLVDLYQNTPRIVVPHGADPSMHKSRLFTETVGGGTPLSDLVDVAAERLEREADTQPFMIVITDGKPANELQYKEALDRTNFPVIGVNIPGGSGSITKAEEFFHRQTVVENTDSIYKRLEELANEVMF